MGYIVLVLAIVEKTPKYPPKQVTEAHRAESARVRTSIGKTLTQAVDLKDLAYQTAMELKEATDPLQEEARRARCQAVASAIKAWDLATDRMRIVRGKPLPSKPDPKPAKRTSLPTFQEHKPAA